MGKIVSKEKLKKLLSGLLYFTLLISAGFSIINSISANGKLVFVTEPPVENEVLKKYVQIAGAVSYPGIYEIHSTTKVGDLILMAGGITGDIDTNLFEQEVNLVRTVEDGEKIVIPAIKSPGTNSPANPSAQTTLIKINSASLKELDTLPGVGEVTAQKIVDNRPFTKLDELVDLKILTQSRFDDMEHLITL